MSLVLDDTTKSIEIVLGGAVTTNQLEWTAHYADYTVGSFTPINSHGVTNNAVDVTMVAAPAASTQRLIQNMTVYNADTVAATVTIKLDDPAVERRLIVVALQPGYSLHFKEDMWQVFNTSGEMMMSGPVGGSGTSPQIAYWSAAQTLTGDTDLTWNVANNRLVMGDGAQIGQAAGPLLTFNDTSNILAITGCKVGLGTTTVPHGGIGYAMLAFEGANASANGPHVQFTTASDDYPLMVLFNWQHDTVGILFDAYYDGQWRSSDPGSNFNIHKASDKLEILYANSVVAGNVIATWGRGITVLAANGNVGFGATAPGSISEWNMADQDCELVDGHNATGVGSIIDVWEVQTGGNTGYIAVYDSYS